MTSPTPVPGSRDEPDHRDEATRILPVAAPVAQTLPVGAPLQGAVVRQVGRYQVIDKLGRGGMATVYKAHDPGIDRPIALKFLHASLCEDEEYRDRFLREARAAGGLSHPHIVTVHDVGEIEGRPYMAMELVDGVPLSDLMNRSALLPVSDVLEMGVQLAGALDYAHAHGVVHRDIKPGNILKLRHANTIKVTDFGIAHVATPGGPQTRVGDVLGTPQYMSPEQAAGGVIDGRSDLFSVGIVLYQLLTGSRPFEGESMIAVALKITREEPAPLAKLRPELPAAVRRIIERCLAKAPERRYQSGRELAEALAKVLAELQQEQRQSERARIVPLRVRWAGLMALIVGLVMAATATFIVQRQYGVLSAQVSDYGVSLARFVAAQNAQAVLADEWIGVDVSIQEIMKTRDFKSVVVVDAQGQVRVSSEAAQVGQPYRAPGGEALGRHEGVQVRHVQLGDEGVLSFDAPLLFQGRELGRVVLGIPEQPLSAAARYTLMLMVVLVGVTVLAVALAMYLLATWFAKPIRLLDDSMEEIARGRYDHRIDEERRDEFGQLYRSFDRMATVLQGRHPDVVAAPAAAGPDRSAP